MGVRFLKLAVLYFVVGVGLGLYMSIAHTYTLTAVHVHVNLLGWVSLALFGCIYSFFPNAANTALAKTHFWLYNIFLPIMMIGLSFVVTGNEALVPAVAAGGVVIVLSVILFAINVLMNVKATDQQASGGN